MREALDHWDFVIAAYAVGLLPLIALMIWSWRTMQNAERRRDEVKRR